MVRREKCSHCKEYKPASDTDDMPIITFGIDDDVSIQYHLVCAECSDQIIDQYKAIQKRISG